MELSDSDRKTLLDVVGEVKQVQEEILHQLEVDRGITDLDEFNEVTQEQKEEVEKLARLEVRLRGN